jgi:carboxymethylenebutenolidase
MCYENDELPPFSPIRGGSDASGDITLTASDGVEFSAFFAHPAVPSNRAVVVFPDVFALGPFYRELTVQFAEAGYHAIAIDYYTRELGREPRPVENGMAAMQSMDMANVDTDAKAAVAWLRGLPGVDIDAVFAVGFCLGGTLVWHQLSELDLDGYVSFYGVPAALQRDRIARMHGSALMLIAGEDRIPVADVEALADEMRAVGVEVETHVHDGAPHGYFSRSGEFKEACDASWAQVLAYFDARSGVHAS